MKKHTLAQQTADALQACTGAVRVTVHDGKHPAAVALGARTSARKAVSSAANGRLGGRPRAPRLAVSTLTNSNGFRGMAALQRAAHDPRLANIEGGGMDEGRVFLHAAPGWLFSDTDTRTRSVGTVSELRAALRGLVRHGGQA